MSIIKSLQWRYATKKFDATKNLPEAKLSILKEAFNLTALSYGLQTLKMVVVENRTLRERLVEVAFGQRQVVDASHLLVLCIQSDINADDVEDHFQTVKEIQETPDEILEPFKAQLKSTIESMPEAKKLDWAARQAYIALGNLMTVCAVEAIDSCPMEGFIPEKLDEVLHLNEKGFKSVLLLPVGYRAEDDMFSQLKKVRKPITETVVEI